MLKIVTAGLAALVVTASPAAFAEIKSPATQNTTEMGRITDARLSAMKSALQLTPEQVKYWPAIEDAVRTRAKGLEARIASVSGTLDEMHDRGPGEVLQNLNPIDLMQRRSDALAQRAANIKKVADAWKPLYQTLSPEQKLRMAFLTISALHEFRNAPEQSGGQFDAYDDEVIVW